MGFFFLGIFLGVFGVRFVLGNLMGLIWLNRWRILKGDLNCPVFVHVHDHDGT